MWKGKEFNKQVRIEHSVGAVGCIVIRLRRKTWSKVKRYKKCLQTGAKSRRIDMKKPVAKIASKQILLLESSFAEESL